MATYVKYYDFVDQLALGKHVFGTAVFKIALSNTAGTLTQTQTILSGITQISGTNGYTTGGTDAQVTWAETTGTGTATGTMVVFTCATGPMGPFQFVVLYNDTQTSPVDPLVCGWDYGSAVTLQIGETFSVKFNNSATTGTIFTLA